MNQQTKVEIFFGTGGVGKTTIATSRGIYLAKKEQKVLLMTIDPSKRLKQVLGITDEDAGSVKQVENFDCKLDALLIDPKATFLGLSPSSNTEIKNKILQVLLRPYGGLHEIFSLVELSRQINSKKYDVIVLDTPPGSHFLEFLEGGQRIDRFFNKKFMEVFSELNKKTNSIFELALKTGINKLLNYLEQVTGKHFVDDFVEAVEKVYQLKEEFNRASKIPSQLKNSENAHWYLITSLNQKKVTQAEKLKSEIQQYIGENFTFILNQSNKALLKDWAPTDNTLQEYKQFLMEKEDQILNSISGAFDSKIMQQKITFPEVLSDSPKEHVIELEKGWS